MYLIQVTFLRSQARFGRLAINLVWRRTSVNPTESLGEKPQRGRPAFLNLSGHCLRTGASSSLLAQWHQRRAHDPRNTPAYRPQNLSYLSTNQSSKCDGHPRSLSLNIQYSTQNRYTKQASLLLIYQSSKWLAASRSVSISLPIFARPG